MKLRNKKTGEIVDLSEGIIRDTYCGEKIQIKPIAISNKEGYVYNSLAALNVEWEDAPEEPKGYCYINEFGTPIEITHTRENIYDKQRKNFGNYFSTREEAELAVRKLKAWKRLKDNGYKFNGIGVEYDGYKIYLKCDIMKKEHYTPTQDHKDLDLLFGGEEWLIKK